MLSVDKKKIVDVVKSYCIRVCNELPHFMSSVSLETVNKGNSNIT